MPVLRFPPLSKANPLSEVAWNPIDVRNANSTVDRVQVEIYTKSKFSGFCLFPCPAADAVCLFLEFLAALYSRRRRTKNRWGLKGPQLSRWRLEGVLGRANNGRPRGTWASSPHNRPQGLLLHCQVSRALCETAGRRVPPCKLRPTPPPLCPPLQFVTPHCPLLLHSLLMLTVKYRKLRCCLYLNRYWRSHTK